MPSTYNFITREANDVYNAIAKELSGNNHPGIFRVFPQNPDEDKELRIGVFNVYGATVVLDERDIKSSVVKRIIISDDGSVIRSSLEILAKLPWGDLDKFRRVED